MSKHQDYVQKTEALVEPILQKYQFELVDVEFVKEAGNWHLRVYIDKEGGITIDDLTLVNHELSDEMDKLRNLIFWKSVRRDYCVRLRSRKTL